MRPAISILGGDLRQVYLAGGTEHSGKKAVAVQIVHSLRIIVPLNLQKF